MNAVLGGDVYVIEEPFERAMKRIRNALEKSELSIAREFDVTGSVARGSGQPSRLLLVDSPLLLFQALALDRAAGVFFPLHVLVSANHDRTEAVCMEPAFVFEVRLPAGAAGPLEALRRRVNTALESVASHHGRAEEA